MADNPNSLLYNAHEKIAPDGRAIGNINLGGTYGLLDNKHLLAATTPQVHRPIVPVVGHVPTALRKLGLVDIFKSTFETCIQSMSGIDFNYSTETSDFILGNDGQNRSAPIAGRRGEVSPSLVIPEIVGSPFGNLFRLWNRIIVDCDTHSSALAGILNQDGDDTPYLLSSYSMDLVLIQYDMSMKVANVIDCIILTQMFPTDTGMMGFGRDIGTGTRPERNITFKAIVQHNTQTLKVGKRIAETLQLHRVDGDKQPPVVSNVESILENSALVRQMSLLEQDAASLASI